MAELVGGALLSAVFQGLLDRISSRNVAEFIMGKKLTKKSIQRLKTALYALRAVLIDAEQRKINSSAAKVWLDDLKDAIYHADDVVDEISTIAATQKEVGNFFARSLNLCHRNIGNKLEGIIERLESILKHKDILGLQESTARANLSWRPQSTSLIEESDVFGRDNDKESIINLLFADDSDDSKVSVITIVGMGGIGKSTLAQVAFNDDRVKQKFDLRTWVCVSEEFDISKITKRIKEAVTSCACDKTDLNLLQLDLKEQLNGKKFLIVLDDIWNENYNDWDVLQRPLQYGMKGSKILVTTRSEKAASIVRTVPSYQICQLSDDDCWLLFAKHALLPKDSTLDPNLEDSGRKLLKKCKGSPLVAKTLAGLLRLNHDIKYWNTILKSDIWEFPENESTILPALRISYHFLSPSLKQCFLYCSIFPKDYEFEKNVLILLWMAEGLLQPPVGEKTLEEVGEEYFHDLVLRSFFQRSYGKDGCFVIHDLMHDLATFEAGGFYFRSERWDRNEITSMTRHIYFDQTGFEDLSKAKFLRTLMMKGCLMPGSIMPHHHPFSKLKCLRVLSFSECLKLEALPDSIDELIHLRYLDLTRASIKKLPKTLCKLYNLQTLKLAHCYCVTELPADIHKLVNLRFLDVRDTKLNEMPKGIGKVKNLQFLSDFVVGKDKGASIMELGELNNLSKSLCIRNLQYAANDIKFSDGVLMDKKSIEDLFVEWSSESNVIDSSHMENHVLDKLRPHKNLKSLSIKGYGGMRFPNWLGYPSYCNVSNVYLVGCKYCCFLPPLGQLSLLKKLRIGEFDRLEQIGAEFYKDDESSFMTPFPSLEYLEFEKMPAWQEWCSVQIDAFPKLRELIIYDCPTLISVFLGYLPALETLEIRTCDQLTSAIPLDNLPNLKELSISDCENLKALSVSKRPLQNLQRVTIISCPNLVCFQGEGLPTPDMITLLPQLQELKIWFGQDVELFPPECGLPPNLSVFVINHRSFAHHLRRNLPNLTSLYLQGRNSNVQCFSEQCLLMPSLTNLQLRDYRCLETLECKAFEHLSSLRSLHIFNCPKLGKISGERLPDSLKELNIVSCPLLDERCVTKHEEIWPKISHIPCVNIISYDRSSIYVCGSHIDTTVQADSHQNLTGNAGIDSYPLPPGTQHFQE